jgi:hypothetical protein
MSDPSPVIAGVDPAVAIAMLPIRIETRFAGTSDAPQLLVRMYPDDLHLDAHDPRLTNSEVSAGKTYWTTTRSGAPADRAWAQLLTDVGPRRALWVRQALTPGNDTGDPVFPAYDVASGSTALAAQARALPESFIVRARYSGGESVVHGAAISDHLQIGVRPRNDGDAPPPPPDGNATLVLDEGMRWMVDFQHAVDAGMAVTIDLPAATTTVDEVLVVGVTAAEPGAGGKELTDLIEAHRLSDGAAFLAAGTPTNNLADSASGYSVSAVPDPSSASAVAPPAGSAAAVLAGALGIDVAQLALLDGAANMELDEAAAMSRALFEATWGSFLRQQAQPGFSLGLLPQVYAHVTTFLRGGGPLPAIRLGRQPYGVVPVMATGAFASAGETEFQTWLGGFLPRIRSLWTSGAVDAPSGPDLFAQEPVTTRVRLRTTQPGPAIDFLIATGFADPSGDSEYSRRSLLAELGFTGAMPSVVRQFNDKGAANLWLPMAADGDSVFNILAPAPKDATSVLGLLLRNSALRIAADATNEFTGLRGGLVTDVVARQGAGVTVANLPAAAGLATAVQSGFTSEREAQTDQTRRAGEGEDVDGATFTVADRLADMINHPASFRADLTRYFNSDALAAFRDALAPLAEISTARRAVLTGEIIDCASHRYDAWVTSIATARLAAMQAEKPGIQVGAWGAVHGIQRREATPVAVTGTIPPDTESARANGGYVLAPSPRHASMAGVLRAAWLAHGGPAADALAPFATGLESAAIRRALVVAEGMRNGQQLGALLGYQLERAIHDASGIGGVEIDWVVFVLRRQFPLKVDTIDNAPQVSSERTVADGWKLAQAEIATPGSVLAGVAADGDPGQPVLSPADRAALQTTIARMLTTLDAFADLGLAESMYQLAGANLERAAAAMDMAGRAATPPEVFESMATPRGGRGIEQRLVVAFGDDQRPAGYATDTPRARLAPAADAFVARRLGPIDAIHVRLLDHTGNEIAAPLLSSLGLSALDIAALDLSAANITLQSWDSTLTMPGAPSPNPGQQGVARLLLAAGQSSAVNVGFDLTADAELLDLLDHAAAWQRTLATRTPLSDQTFTVRAQLDSGPDASTLAATVAALSAELATASPAALPAWGLAASDADGAARRVATAAKAADPTAAAAALMGGPAVVEGTMPALPADIATGVADQAATLGAGSGVLTRWLQDTARVRDAADALQDALLRDDLAGSEAVGTWASQSPAAPWADGVDPSAARRWVGLTFPAALAAPPVTSVVLVGDDVTGAVTGIELDAWTEVVPSRTGAAAVAANLSAPDARAPNVILLAVPPDTSQPWTESALFSVVEEALELAECRMVDYDATRRVPAFLPAVYLAEYDEDDVGFRKLLGVAHTFPSRWVSASS